MVNWMLLEFLFKDYWVDRLLRSDGKLNAFFISKWFLILLGNILNLNLTQADKEHIEDGSASLNRGMTLSYLMIFQIPMFLLAR